MSPGRIPALPRALGPTVLAHHCAAQDLETAGISRPITLKLDVGVSPAAKRGALGSYSNVIRNYAQPRDKRKDAIITSLRGDAFPPNVLMAMAHAQAFYDDWDAEVRKLKRTTLRLAIAHLKAAAI